MWLEHYISIHKTCSKLLFQRLYNVPEQAYKFATLNNIGKQALCMDSDSNQVGSA